MALLLAAAGVLLTAGAAVVALGGDMPSRISLAERHALSVAAPIAVGIYAWREGTHTRFGRLLVLAGAGWFVASLSASDIEVLHSIGRVAGWAVEAGLIYLILAFPSGRLTTRVDRLIAGAAGGLIALLYAPTALVVEGFPAPSPLTTCMANCPANAFMLLGSEPAWVDSVVLPIREALTVLLTLAVITRLALRIWGATRLMRMTLTPVFAFAMLRTLALGVAVVLRRGGADDAAAVAAAAVGLGLPAMSVGFLIGLLRWRIHTADSLLGLTRGLRDQGGAQRRRALIADTLSDPTVELAYRRSEDGGAWHDADGAPVTLPPPGGDRHATVISDDTGPVAAVIHDAALSEQSPFVEAVGSYALVWDHNRRLAAQVEESLAELRASRARILVAADDERRRIERDLHDGGQQRLVALRIRLELAEETMTTSPARARQMLHRLGDDVDAALEELRALAAGVYPPMLEDRGLSAAIRAAALQSPIPARVSVHGSDRYPEDVETAAYFCCVEALQNVAKHAPEATSVQIALSRNGDLRFEVSDNGSGFAQGGREPGRGLLNMRDRLGAVGGELEVSSGPGEGTTVVGRVPVPER
jgi:signal transduction histidine kinase